MAWYDEVLDTVGDVGNSLLDAGKFVGKGYLAYKAPVMYKAIIDAENRARDQQQRQEFNKNYMGSSATPAVEGMQAGPTGYVPQSLQQGQPSIPGSGVKGGGWSPIEKAVQMMSSPDAIARTAGGASFRDQNSPVTPRQMKTIIAGVEGDKSGRMRQVNRWDAGQGKFVPTSTPAYKSGEGSKITIDNRELNAYDQAMGKTYGGKMAGLQEKATNATNMAREYRDIAKASEGMYTGTFGTEIQSLRKFGASIGLPVEILGSSKSGELIQSISNQLVMKLRGQKEAGLTGSTSDRDLQFLIDSVPGLLNTKGGLEYLAETMENYAQIQRDVSEFAESKGRYKAGTANAINRRFKDRSIIPDREIPTNSKENTVADNSPLTPDEQEELRVLETKYGGK